MYESSANRKAIKMADSKLKSLSESGVNIAIGFGINYVSNLFILPYYAPALSVPEQVASAAAIIGVWYTIISLVRSYGLRRLFDRFGPNENAYTLLVKGINRLRRKKEIKPGDIVQSDGRFIGVASNDAKDGEPVFVQFGSVYVHNAKPVKATR